MRALLAVVLMFEVAFAGEIIIPPLQAPDWARRMTPEQRRNYEMQVWSAREAERKRVEEARRAEQQAEWERAERAYNEAMAAAAERKARMREEDARAFAEAIADSQRQQQEREQALRQRQQEWAEREAEIYRLKAQNDAEEARLQERIKQVQREQREAEARRLEREKELEEVERQLEEGRRKEEEVQRQIEEKRTEQNKSKAEQTVFEMPPEQHAFLAEMRKFIKLHKSAKTDNERKSIWNQAAKKYSQIFTDFTVSNWIGKVFLSGMPIGDTKGDRHAIAIFASEDPFVLFNTTISESVRPDNHHTIILKNSSLFPVASKLKEGDTVRFSGIIAPDIFDFDKSEDYFGKDVVHDFIYSPAFLTRFTAIEKFVP